MLKVIVSWYEAVLPCLVKIVAHHKNFSHEKIISISIDTVGDAGFCPKMGQGL
jgi:hypothetical protein